MKPRCAARWSSRARGLYSTHPNPRVGACWRATSEIVGEGWHERAGEAHAEPIAIRAAGERARGATAYVTLEPCSHHGRTPPCVDALLAAGVRRVVYAVGDPNPRVNGAVRARLREAGIAVQSGLLRREAEELNAGFMMRMRHGRPFVRVKTGASLDGRTALANGESQWITGEAARADVQHWRARSGACSPARHGARRRSAPRRAHRDAAPAAARRARSAPRGCARRRASSSAPGDGAGVRCADTAARGRRERSRRWARRASSACASLTAHLDLTRVLARLAELRDQRGAGRGRAAARRRAARRAAWSTNGWCTSRRNCWGRDARPLADAAATHDARRPRREFELLESQRGRARTCGCGCGREGEAPECSPGIVQEVGELRRSEARAGARRRVRSPHRGRLARRIDARAARARRQHLRGRRVPDGRRARRAAASRPMCPARRLRVTTLGAQARRRARESRAGAARRRQPRRPLGLGPRRRHRRGAWPPPSDARSLRVELAAPQPLARYIARKGSVTLDGVSLTVNDVDGATFRVNLIPHTLEVTTLGALAAGRAAQSGDRPAGALRGAALQSETRMKPLNSIEEILADIAAGRMVVIMDDEDRENEGDLVMAAQKVRAGRHQLHGALRPRPHLPDADRASAAAAAPAADGERDGSRASHQLHGVDRSGRRRDHRHLRARSRAHGAHRGEAGRAPRGPAPARPHLSRDGAARRRADARRSHRGGLRSGAARGLRAGGGDRRDHERRRHHGAPPGARGIRRAARAQDRHHRRPDPLPPAQGALGRAHRRAAGARPSSASSGC